MKIEQVETFFRGSNHYVLIHTDKGITGLGQSGCWAYPDATDSVLKHFSKYLVGKDPLRIEHHWQYLYRMGPFRGSILSAALSAVDIALWDIKGQYLNAPVWQLLGGNCRDKIRLHLLLGSDSPDASDTGFTPEYLYNLAKKADDDGFTAMKIDPIPDNFQNLSVSSLIKKTRDLVAAMRKGAGTEADIILEIHRKLTPMNSIMLAKELEEFHPMFYEDPIQIDSIQSQSEIAKRITLPVANGERLHTIYEFRELLANGGSQYVRPDLGLAGGITQCKKIAAIAESYHSAVVTHNFLGPVLTAASVHLDVSIPNFIVQEYSMIDENPINDVFNSSLKREGGYLLLPQETGLGVRIDRNSIKDNFIPRNLENIPLRDDGSVGYSV